MMLVGAALTIGGLLGSLSLFIEQNPWALSLVWVSMLGFLMLGIGFIDSMESWGP